MSGDGPTSEAGDGHEHGCLDALAMTLSSSSEFEHLNFQLVIKQLKEAGLHSAEDLWPWRVVVIFCQRQ